MARMSSSLFTSDVNRSCFCRLRSAGVSSSRLVILNPATMVSTSRSSPKKFGSIAGWGQRIGAVQPDAADALRPQQADMAGEAGAPARLAAVIFNHGHAEMQLDVGQFQIGLRPQEA